MEDFHEKPRRREGIRATTWQSSSASGSRAAGTGCRRVMNIALVVPGGVDRSGEYRVIPALLALIKRLSLHNAVHVFALGQEPQPGSWELAGARIHNIGAGNTRLRAVRAICAQHRLSRFQIVHAIWSGSPGLVAVTAARLLRIASLVHIAGGELV